MLNHNFDQLFWFHLFKKSYSWSW